ncbi:Uncharacterised protein [[Clostridium] sordellii]|nr:Uncharacterised protein [[Clostridium] sordellii] [Paeniclostridium sordellii]
MYNKKIWGFILTMWYVKTGYFEGIASVGNGFILTMWYVKK